MNELEMKRMSEMMASMVLPHVIEKGPHGRERAWDIYSRLMKDRIIFIGTPINDFVSNTVAAQLLFLHLQSKAPIDIYLNTPGGSVTAGMAIYDVMKHLPNVIQTYCLGCCASMGAVLLAAGTKGHRFILPHGEVMIHQPWGGTQGTVSDIVIQAKNIERWKSRLLAALSECTGQPVEKVMVDADRDFYLTAEEARDYGLVDIIMEQEKKDDPPTKDGPTTPTEGEVHSEPLV